MIFVDASAIVAILTQEPESDSLLALLEQDRSRATSPIAVFEGVAGISRKRRISVQEAEEIVYDFLGVAGIAMISITSKEAVTALAAFSRYGKGRHSARLNLGDCFAYAAAKNLRSSLLFKGDDFSKTDVRSAARPR